MRYLASVVFMLGSSIFLCSQGPCTETAVKLGRVPMAEDVFSYTPSFGEPIIGKVAFLDAARKTLTGRTNIEHTWESDHRIVASVSGDMAYEHGTMEVSYNEDGKSRSTKLVILGVYKAKGDVCERVAQTIQRLEEDVIPSLHDVGNK